VEPHVIRPADGGNLLERIDRSGVGRAGATDYAQIYASLSALGFFIDAESKRIESEGS
jgi:hypothetical protein